MATTEHGGFCCGISHVYEFPTRPNIRWLEEQMEEAARDIEEENEYRVEDGLRALWRGKFGHAIEVCLTDEQMIAWAPILKKKGFKLGLRWLNDNSGNYCNLLSWAPKRAGKKRPYKW